MYCEKCDYNLWPDGRNVVECRHPDRKDNSDDCPIVDAIENHSQAHGEGRLQDERTSEPKIRY